MVQHLQVVKDVEIDTWRLSVPSHDLRSGGALGRVPVKPEMPPRVLRHAVMPERLTDVDRLRFP